MKRFTITLSALILPLLLLSGVAASVPRLINYQGVLTDTSGATITGTHDLTFTIYADSSLSALALWSETQADVEVENGLFNAILGEVAEIPDSLFAGEDRWLGITVDLEPEMTPRHQITSVPWAFRAASAGSADSIAWGDISDMPAGFADGTDDIGGVGDGHSLDAADGSPVDALYVDDAGRVGIGTKSPGALLTLYGAYPSVYIRSAGGSGSFLSFHCEPADDYIWTLGHLYHCGMLSLDCGGLNVMHFHYGGQIGIGTLSPEGKVDVNGTVKMNGFLMKPNAASGRVLTVDDYGYGSWQALPSSMGGSGTSSYVPKFTGASTIGDSPIYVTSENVGIGTTNPLTRVHVVTTSASQAGVFSINNPTNANGAVYGVTNGIGYGIHGQHGPTGNYGYLGGSTYGVYGRYGSSNHGALGTVNYGVWGVNPSGGVAGRFEGRMEVTGAATISGPASLSGGATISSGATISGNTLMNNNLTVAGTLTAGTTTINGNLSVLGALTKLSGSFLIDHPLDPENKTLRHNFVESPENLLIYRGKVKLDEEGEGEVEMPDYFAALSAEENATVTLTAIGRPFLAGYEWHSDLSRLIVYGEPNREVAWVVYADRDDPAIHALSQPVEEEKGHGKVCDKGEYLYPAAYERSAATATRR